jgi:hypothetical protein
MTPETSNVRNRQGKKTKNKTKEIFPKLTEVQNERGQSPATRLSDLVLMLRSRRKKW